MATRVASYERIIEKEHKVKRQSVVNRLIHWAIALSIFSLFVSGFGQMPIFKRYGVADLPGMAWMANYATTLAIHYVATAVLLFAASFHLLYHSLRREFGLWPRRGDLSQSLQIIKAMLTGGKEPPSDKYLAEQRIAYAYIASNVGLLVLSGFLKLADNHPWFELPAEVAWTATTVHNVSMLLLLFGIVGHLAAFAIPANRKLIGGMFHGKVDLDYAVHRHCLWCERLLQRHGTEMAKAKSTKVAGDETAAAPGGAGQYAPQSERPHVAGGED